MAEKKIALGLDLKAVDDERTLADTYLVRIHTAPDGKRSMVFDGNYTFSKSQTTTEKLANLAEVMAFMSRRIKRLEARVKAQQVKNADFEARLTALETP